MTEQVAGGDTGRQSDVVRATLRPTARGKIVGRSAALRDAVAVIDRVARSEHNVLITGESGTGKEGFAAAIHEASARSQRPLVVVNCGALPESLIESELFGHARGAFTGAHAARQGLVARAEGGTLFLDEIGELPLHLQAKLLRLLQCREYAPVGDSRTLRCDVRFIAATNRLLADEVAQGRFREDLYYRLNVVQLRLPALRERLDDVPLLVEHFFARAGEVAGRDDLRGISAPAMAALQAHDWPGNVRELENCIHRAVILARGPWVEASDVPLDLGARAGGAELVRQLPDAGVDLRAVVDAYERTLLLQALERTQWNKNRAAQLLGLNRTTLVEMVKRKNLRGRCA
ncbi:MAG: sigma-54-dependent Fis family transcriptional regulator [Myxococcales bacterium]|nr:sigma-54-dependent Fis family transcriptional regulator [Myxococcales bacterium]